MEVAKRQWEKFADWVDSHGEDAGDWMVIGVICAGVVAGVLSLVLGFVFASAVLISIGFGLVLLHGGFVMAWS